LEWYAHGSPSYPPLLHELSDPPLLLYYRGVLPDRKPMVAVVGTRNPSGSGRTQAYRLGFELGTAGIPVVSGLARGIDSMAHRGNLEGKGKTVAVLGNGLDSVYPVSNRGLALRVLDTGGCLVSEYPPGVPPYKWHFPARNRIIAVLGRATIVVEAPEHSGALITASLPWIKVGMSGLVPYAAPVPWAKAAETGRTGCGIYRFGANPFSEWGKVVDSSTHEE